MDTRRAYPSDLTDAQWELLSPFFSDRPAGMRGRPRTYSYREIVNAILYLLRTGCQWRGLPHDLPPYTTVSNYYPLWRRDGLLERLHDALRGRVRKEAGRPEEPQTLRVDSQSVKTAEKGGRPTPATLSASTRARRSRAASATSPSTASA